MESSEAVNFDNGVTSACMYVCMHEGNKNGALIQHKMDFVSVNKQVLVSVSYHII